MNSIVLVHTQQANVKTLLEGLVLSAVLCVPCSCRELGGDIMHDADFLVFEGNHFRNGFMYKSFTMSAIIHDGVKPTLQELEKFEATPEEVEIEGECA